MKNIYYFSRICQIGGIETFFYQLAKKYQSRDITIYYNEADKDQLRRLQKYVRCIQYKPGMEIKCDKAFFNFNIDIIDHVEAKEYCLIVHGDYKWLNCPPPQHPRITKYYGVSKAACDSFTELTGKPCELLYNPISIEKASPVIRLVSACRLGDPIKGGNRTIELAKALDKYAVEHGYNYTWEIFANCDIGVPSDNVVVRKPRLDISSFLANADFVVQLSDNVEGFNYTINEALLHGTPVVVTPCNVYEELGVSDDMAIRLNFDLSNMDEVVERIFKSAGEMEFSYTPPEDNWGKVLARGKSTYIPKQYKVKATSAYCEQRVTDSELGYAPESGAIFIVDEDRLDVLLGNNEYNLPFVEVVEVIVNS